MGPDTLGPYKIREFRYSHSGPSGHSRQVTGRRAALPKAGRPITHFYDHKLVTLHVELLLLLWLGSGTIVSGLILIT